jgi:hypothetical protein
MLNVFLDDHIVRLQSLNLVSKSILLIPDEKSSMKHYSQLNEYTITNE